MVRTKSPKVNTDSKKSKQTPPRRSSRIKKINQDIQPESSLLNDSQLNESTANNSSSDELYDEETDVSTFTYGTQPESSSFDSESFHADDQTAKDSTSQETKVVTTLDKTPKKQEPTRLGPLLIITLLVLAMAVWFVYFPTENSHFTMENAADQLKNQLKLMASEIGSQDAILWKIAKVNLVKHKNNSDNRQPAVLMLASDKTSYLTTKCLASNIAAAYSNNCTKPSMQISGGNLKNLPDSEAKFELDRMLTAHFESGACAVVVDRLDLIPAAATTVFYQFCENDNAPYKNVAIVFTLQVENGDWTSSPQDLSNLPPRLWDETVDKFLQHSLQTRDPGVMTDDMIAGLMSRITPAVAWVKKADPLTLCNA